jgi:Tol biopolymer transport system component
VAFESAATNLIAGDTNEAADIFVRDLAPGRTERVSLTPDGAQTTYYSQHASISADGSRVAFQTSPGLVPPLPPVFQDLAVCVRDRRRHTTVEASDGVSDPAFPVNSNVTPAISDNGRFVTFTFTGTRVIGADAISSVWVRDLRTGRLRLASPAADVDNPLAGSSASDLSGDGRLVVFASTDRLVPSDTDDLLDVYLRDLRTGGLRRVSAAGPVDQSTSGLGSTTPSIAGGGRHVAFYSDVAGLAPGGIPGRGDIYRYSSPAT